ARFGRRAFLIPVRGAVRLRTAGRPVPYHNERTEPVLKLARSLRLVVRPMHVPSAAVTVDGEEFPWYLAERGPSVEYGGSMHVVTLPLLVENVEFVQEVADE